MKILPLILLFFLTSQSKAQALFTDDSLKKLLTRSPQGMIFLWSPLMPLSVLGRAEVLEISQELGFDVLILVDPHFPAGDLNPLMVSEKLLSLGILNHYPALVLYKNQSLLPWMIQGYEDKENLKKLISEQMEIK